MADSQGLKHASDRMIEMKADKNHRDEIRDGNRQLLESENDHGIHVMFSTRIDEMKMFWIRGAEREMHDVIHDERKDGDAGEQHRARGERCFDPLLFCVRHRSSRHVEEFQPDRRPYVEDQAEQENQAQKQKDRTEAVQEHSIRVDMIPSVIDQKVSTHVNDQVHHQCESCRRHHDLAEDRRLKETSETCHRDLAMNELKDDKKRRLHEDGCEVAEGA